MEGGLQVIRVPGYKLQVYVLVVRFYVWGVPFLRFPSVFLRFLPGLHSTYDNF